MNGILVVDKPKGPTSSDVVQLVRRALKEKKAGHTGTLDPMATGVLALCLGDATRVAQVFTDGDKAYDATVKLGVTTDTLDAEGQVLGTSPVPAVTAESLEAVLSRFRGPQRQTPPMYSAVKKDGRRLYELARSGEEVEREARDVTVYALTLNDFSADELKVSVRCSKGFFVRMLAADLGEALGCGAHLSALRRTQSGPFSLAQALPLSTLLDQGPVAAEGRLVPVDEALSFLPEVKTTPAEAERVRHGGLVEVPRADCPLVRVTDEAGHVLALAELKRGRLVYKRVLASG
ncbi:MAG: tRNA pseudouridine(55) synthase TruB [Myxococcaceae bacterium]|jgi:tRNA pseudouridine55 synthase|nr:tRNA pseudouridine(55) synthase TruB [Myxococcaceae bacterium]MCA3013020.1 tRNA pseudouridine(55) synthase TruB [Myxococcaceae bacterium]